MNLDHSGKRPAASSSTTALAVTTPPDEPEMVEIIYAVFVDKRCLANWDKWSRVPVVTLRQAVHLSFGVEHSSSHLGSNLATPLAERLDLAIANIGVGGPLEIVADPFGPIAALFNRQGNTVRLRLATFSDWVLANDLPLDPNSPRSQPRLPDAPNLAFERQQKTYLKIIGMLARTVARNKRSAMRNDKIIVSAVVQEALDACQTPDGPLGVKKSTLAEYIPRGLNLLLEQY